MDFLTDDRRKARLLTKNLQSLHSRHEKAESASGN